MSDEELKELVGSILNEKRKALEEKYSGLISQPMATQIAWESG